MYKNGIRTTEFFRDHDKLRSGVITENQVHLSSCYITSMNACLISHNGVHCCSSYVGYRCVVADWHIFPEKTSRQ